MGKSIYRELARTHKTYRLKRPNTGEVILENTTVIAEVRGFDPALEQDCLHYHSVIEKVEEWCHERSHLMVRKQALLLSLEMCRKNLGTVVRLSWSRTANSYI